MRISKNLCLFFCLMILCQMRSYLCVHLKKSDLSFSDFLPSSSLLYPLDFQKNWQASEPIPLTITYDVPAFGSRDLFLAMSQNSDLENQTKEREELRNRIIDDQKAQMEYLRKKLIHLKIEANELKKQNSLRSPKGMM